MIKTTIANASLKGDFFSFVLRACGLEKKINQRKYMWPLDIELKNTEIESKNSDFKLLKSEISRIKIWIII